MISQIRVQEIIKVIQKRVYKFTNYASKNMQLEKYSQNTFDDIVQDVFLSLMETEINRPMVLEDGSLDNTGFCLAEATDAYVSTRARMLCLDKLKKRKLIKDKFIGNSHDEDFNDEEHLHLAMGLYDETHNPLYQLELERRNPLVYLDSLKDNEKVIIQALVGGAGYHEISADTGMTYQYTKKKIHNIRNKMKVDRND